MESHEGRIAVAEEKIRQMEKKLDQIDEKLDDLLGLRHKGAGAFWLASSLVGTGIVTVVLQFFHWFKGV